MSKKAKAVATYTPEPWEMVRYEGEPGAKGHWSGWHIKQLNSGLTDVAYVDDVDYGPEVAEANARLIIAAPEAHEANKIALDVIREMTNAFASDPNVVLLLGNYILGSPTAALSKGDTAL